MIKAIRDSGAQFYALVLTEGDRADLSDDEVRQRNVVLDRGTRENGGTRETVISNMALKDRLDTLASELLGQVAVTYASPDRLVPAEKITIAAAREGLTARGVPVQGRQDAGSGALRPMRRRGTGIRARRRGDRDRGRPAGRPGAAAEPGTSPGLAAAARRRAAAGLAPPAAGAPASQPAAPQRPSFRGGVDVVSLNVTVTDQSRNFVTSLEQGDFVVFEDGVKQDLTYFNKAQLPVALSLLIDTSASMEDKLRLAQEAAVGFVRRLKPEDMAQVIDFDNRVSILQQFTSDRPALETAIRQTVPNGSTSLHNAIYISLKELKKVRATSSGDVRRQAIVVLSDGEDTSSLVPFEEVLDLAKRSEVIVYTIGDPRPRPRRARLPRSRVRAQAVRPGDRRPRLLPDRRHRAGRPSTRRSPTSWRRSTRWPTRRATRGATASGAASSSAPPSPSSRRAPSRATSAR